jgi:FkbM family methyltransferase
MNLLTSISGLLRYRFKLYYAEIKTRLNGGSFIYFVKDRIKFVCNKNDFFSKIIFISNGHEKLEMDWCNQWIKTCNFKPIIVDCGANIGFFSAVLAQLNPSAIFYSIEGNKNTMKQLLGNIDKLQIKNILPIQAILADSTSESYLIPDEPGREPWQQAKTFAGSDVLSLTLDGLLEERKFIPDLVKIDCEGFEVKILYGASKLLSNCSTVFMVECNDGALIEAGTSRTELFEIFINKNYKLFHLASFDLKIELGVVIHDGFLSKEFNFVAIPNKREFLTRWENTLKAINGN